VISVTEKILAVELAGIEREIANAAYQGGFQTNNHEALFNLIWAVKRIALRRYSRSGELRPRPPKHPVYPDRYRPSGLGDNTEKKRKRVRATSDTNRLIPVKPNTVTAIVNKSGTREEPILLDSDDEKPREAVQNQSKRPRLAVPKQEPVQPPPATSSHAISLAENDKVQGGTIKNANQTDEVVSALRQVQNQLAAVRIMTTRCRIDMHRVYDKHGTRFSKETANSVEELADDLHKVLASAESGIGQVDKAIEGMKEVKEEAVLAEI
jgi:hypothetical protein